ncbi:MAG TPA: tRNA uracil 4-sulfurtransferase ThiI [Actinomycetota bacterium]|nr:tRNA uracil 4-sulfurtransferase ThiI [Actinomycetota bacterium]
MTPQNTQATRPGDSPGLVIAHYQELGLKGRNRSFFERTLASNIAMQLSGVPGISAKPIPGRLIVRMQDRSCEPQVIASLSRTFGLSSFSPAFELVRPDMESITRTALEMADSAEFESFKVRARRGNSSFETSSMEINVAVGQAIKDHTGARVDLGKPDWTCYIELTSNRAYFYNRKIPGPGGLPVGTSGRVLALLSGGIDSPVAAWRMARRGAEVDFVHFSGQPFADPSSARQATQLARHLAPWTLRSKLWIVQFGDIQSEIVTSAPQELRIVLYRRMMMRISEALARREGVQALVTGECLGQVASQTLPNLTATGEVVESLPVLRPLIGFDKLEIEATGKMIGTYEISIQPHQDCCVLFIPRQVTTAARPVDVAQAESVLDVEGMVDKAVANAEVIDVGLKPAKAAPPGVAEG